MGSLRGRWRGRILLIAPSGIEIHSDRASMANSGLLLIAPSGIEIPPHTEPDRTVPDF